jgi:hypothetical protein
LVYVSRWSSPERASAFAAIYAQSLAKRYKQVREVTSDGKISSDNLQKIESLTGSHTWLTDEGPAVIDVNGESVLITESLDEPTTERLRRELFGAAVAAGK